MLCQIPCLTQCLHVRLSISRYCVQFRYSSAMFNCCGLIPPDCIGESNIGGRGGGTCTISNIAHPPPPSRSSSSSSSGTQYFRLISLQHPPITWLAVRPPDHFGFCLYLTTFYLMTDIFKQLIGIAPQFFLTLKSHIFDINWVCYI